MKNYLVSTDWLANNIDNVKILDGSWHMPNTKRNALEEYSSGHIKNAIFFDLDKNSKQNTKIPHMMPDKKYWEKLVSKLGINNSDHIIVYDNSDVISSCRIWFNFIYFGHNPNLISILDGGLKKWIKENRKITTDIKINPLSSYIAEENLNMVVTKEKVDQNIISKKFELIDARSEARFLGKQLEPRKELKSGNIKGSKNLPFQNIINEDNTFKNKDEIELIFKNLNLDSEKTFVFSCGSGVTACVLGLANSIVSGKKPVIYDGSWSEYGLK
jgi:thiosulfate/3-mercaptopyruvate sulfurtransferase